MKISAGLLPYYEPVPGALVFSHKTSTGNASYAYHRHNACEVFLFLSGNIRFYIEQTCFSPVPGSLVLLNPSEMHRVQSVDDSRYERIVLQFQPEYMETLSADGASLSGCFYARPLGRQNLCVLSPDALQEFLSLYAGLESSLAPDCFSRTTVQNAYASLLLVFLNRQFQTSSVPCKNTMPPYITGAMQYMEAHLAEPLCLSSLAKSLSVSGSYLSAQFKRHTGLTMRAYLLDRKISRAKTLLLHGASVTEACYGSGFGDYANFIRSFKKATGVSPGRFR